MRRIFQSEIERVLMYMGSRWRQADSRLRISGVIQGEGEQQEERFVLVRIGA